MEYSSPSLRMVEEFKEDEHFYAPKIPWLTVVAIVLITVGQTLTH